MRTTRLADTALVTSILGLGCADLFREPSERRRRRLLDAALDAGICHFDVAPMYGLGVVERELGRFARGRRDRVVIVTKFGIAPSPAARILAHVQAPLQRALAGSPTLRKRARPGQADPRSGTVGGVLYRNTGYDAAAARKSLEQSLRDLQSDYVDAFFLHDPHPGDIRSDDVRHYLESARDAGLIRAWGVAGEYGSAVATAERVGTPVPVLQLRDDIFLRSRRQLPEGVARATILFGAVGRALPRILAHISHDDAVARRWREAVGDTDAIASLLLRDALRENDGGPVLFATISEQRIGPAVAAAQDDDQADAALNALRALVEAELTARP
jgi:D-threo-aldose 1-dehydrogenase